MIGGDAFQPADGNRFLIDSPAAARRLTGTIADAAQNSREDVRIAIFDIGVAEAALGDQSYI